MLNNTPVTVLGEKEELKKSSACIEAGNSIRLDILAERLEFPVAIASEQIRLSDIVPLAQLICSTVGNMVVEQVVADGIDVPCRQGCCSCCYYLVPLSVPEAFWLREKILSMETPLRKQMLRNWLLASRRILRQRPPEFFETQPAGIADNESVLKTISNWYKNLKLACPFLFRGSCTIYSQRPLACREHMVTGFSTRCKGGRSHAKVIEMPVQMLNILAELASRFEGRAVESVIMSSALPWCEANLERAERRWPVTKVLDQLAGIIKEKTSEKFKAVIA